MLIKKVLASVQAKIFTGKAAETELNKDDAQNLATSGGELVLRLGDELFDSNRDEEAEATYRRALNSNAPIALVNSKLQKVVARIARKYDEPGMLMEPPGKDFTSTPALPEFYSTLDAVNKELATVPEATPSKFWISHAERHVQLLVKLGLSNFKRTVAHNYYNWLTVSINDYQISSLRDLWSLHGSPEALTDEMEHWRVTGNASQHHAFKDIHGQLIYKLGVSLLWDYTLHTDHHGLLRKIAEPLAGNPLRITRRGRLLSQDLAHSVRERNLILDASGLAADSVKPIVIGELGAGHGRLAHMFGMSTNCKYVIFDIAPALLVSQWYIQSLFPDEKIFAFRPFNQFEEIAEELSECKFAFFSSNQLEKFPDNYFNLFINVCSLMEMRVDTINYFFRQIERVTSGFFYTKQWLLQNNREDDIVIEKDDYPVPLDWKNLHDSIDPINKRLFQELWEVP